MEYGNWFPPNLGGDMAGRIDTLIDWVHWFMLLLFVGWGIFFVYCLAKFRARSGHKAQYEQVKAKPSKLLEVGVVIFEVILLVGFSIPAWAKLKNKIPSGPDVVHARVVAEQFAWNFHYAGPDGVYGSARSELMTKDNPLGLDPDDPAGKDDVITLNELHIPAGKDIVLQGSSKDVIHSFYIPVLRVKQDLIPGMSVPIWFKAREGVSSDDVREQLIADRPLDEAFERRSFDFLAGEDLKGKDGNVIVAKGGGFNEESIKALKAAGFSTIKATPRNPTEIACAQLCGNSHFKMKGFVVIESQADFDAWLKAKAAEAAEEGEWE